MMVFYIICIVSGIFLSGMCLGLSGALFVIKKEIKKYDTRSRDGDH